MYNAINKERDMNMGYTSLIWELTQEVDKLGGNPGIYRDRLTKLSSH